MRQIEHEEIKLQLKGMLFTWDEEKERINIRKHGADFRTAASAFLDGNIVLEENSVDIYTGEIRDDITQNNFSKKSREKGEDTLC